MIGHHLYLKIFSYCSEKLLNRCRSKPRFGSIFRQALVLRIEEIRRSVPELYFGGDLHKFNPKCNTLLQKYCRDGKVLSLDKLIDQFENIDRDFNRDKCGYWDLVHELDFHYGLLGACEANNVELVELMVEYGAREWTKGMSIAIKKQNVEVIRWLLENDECDQLGKDNIDLVFDLFDHWKEVGWEDQSPVFKVVRSCNSDLADEVNFEIEKSEFRRAADICGSEFDSDEFDGGYYDYV